MANLDPKALQRLMVYPVVYPVTNTLPHGTQIGIYSLFSSCTGHRRRKTKEQKP